MILHFRHRLGSIGGSLRCILALSVVLSLLYSSLVSFPGSISSPIFVNALAQPADGDKPPLQSTIDDRAAQSLENAKKLRQVAGERIPNHYIVVLKDKTAPAAEVQSAAEEARSQGAVLRHLYEHAIRGYAIRIPNDKVLDSILKNPEVDYVQPDVKVKAFSQTLPTGIDRVDGDLSATKSGDGTGTVDVDIAILDTGIDLSNPDLNVYRQTTFVSGTSSGADDDGHGTMVAGVAAAKDDSQGVVGMAPGARLWAIKVLDSNGDGFDSDIIEGIDYITQHANEIDVVNMSFGGDGPDIALHTAIINSVNAGVTYTAAAGNEAVDAGSVVPASFLEVIAVSAIVDTDGKCGGLSSTSTTAGNDDTFASFSNYGSVVDIAAPGVLVKTTARGGSTASFSGTSAATPHVTGAAALYKVGHPGAKPSDILNGLRNAGSTSATSCDGKGHGYFIGDRDSTHEPLLYMASSTSSSDTTPPTVVSTNPSSGATGIAATSSIIATFSEAVQGTTVSTSTFTLKNSAGTSISGSVSLGTDTKTATFKPTSSLAASTSYTATVTTGVKDLAGNTMTTAKSWSFTTAPPPPPSSSCDNNLPVSSATSSGSQSTFPPTNAIDNNLNTKWYSTFIVNPWIRLDLGAQKSICSVAIAWSDGASRQYSFFISGSSDGTSFNTLFTGKSSGTSSSPQKYSFAESSVRYVKITVTTSHVGSTTSITQISEVDVFGKTSTSAVSASSESHSNSKHTKSSSTQNGAITSNTINHRPIAKDDTIKTTVNTQVVASILDNDVDQDGDKLNVISVSHHTKNGGTVTLSNNGSVTLLPAPNFVGLDTFSYTISDGKGKTDKAKVSIFVTGLAKSDKLDVTSQQEEAAKQQQENNVQLKNKADNNIILEDNLTTH